MLLVVQVADPMTAWVTRQRGPMAVPIQDSTVRAARVQTWTRRTTIYGIIRECHVLCTPRQMICVLVTRQRWRRIRILRLAITSWQHDSAKISVLVFRTSLAMRF